VTQAYRVQNGETLDKIAAKFGMEAEGLRAVNGIGAKARIPVGRTRLVPTQGPSEAAAVTLSNAVFTTVPQGRTFYYRVQRGDSLPSIAARYGVSAADLRRWNGLVQNSVQVGKTLRINPDGSIPTDNPFYSTATGNHRAIWALGLRNPFTFAINPNSGRMFINDVGAGAWEEVNDGRAGAEGLWEGLEVYPVRGPEKCHEGVLHACRDGQD